MTQVYELHKWKSDNPRFIEAMISELERKGWRYLHHTKTPSGGTECMVARDVQESSSVEVPSETQRR